MSKFSKLNKWIKNDIIDYLPVDKNFTEYSKTSKIFQSNLFQRLAIRNDVARLCIEEIKHKHDFLNTTNWRNSMFEVFLNDELYFFNSSELLSSWNEPLVVIFAECFEEKPNLDLFRVKVEEFLSIFKHYEHCYFRLLNIYWKRKNDLKSFYKIFYIKAKFKLLEYFNNRYYSLEDF